MQHLSFKLLILDHKHPALLGLSRPRCKGERKQERLRGQEGPWRGIFGRGGVRDKLLPVSKKIP